MAASIATAPADPPCRRRTARFGRGRVAAVAAFLLVAASCGGDDATSSSTPVSTVSAATTTPDTTEPTVTEPTVTEPPPTEPVTPPTEASTSVPTTTPAGAEALAIWPAPGVVFDTPTAAAEDFVTEVLGVPPTLGEFQPGDARSGEIEVFSPGEGAAATPSPRSVLLLRQLGPRDGWFVIAAVDEHASIDSPSAGAIVPAGEFTVSGVARGFEANVNVSARIAGVAEPLAEQITMGGAMETAEPFSVTIDLSGAAAGDVIMLLVRGGVGLETDPGNFGAIAVTVG